MHIQDGVIEAWPVLVAGTAAGAAGVAVGLRRLGEDDIPRTGILTAAFFVASLVPVPVFGVNAHLLLVGLMGLVLGWRAFPAVAVGLFLQKVLFGVGGLTTLGINTMVMALPAVACWYVLARPIRRSVRPARTFALGAAAGLGAVALAAVLYAGVMAAAGRGFLPVAGVVVAAHLPVMAVEALATGSVAAFLLQVRPGLLDLPAAAGPTAREGTRA